MGASERTAIGQEKTGKTYQDSNTSNHEQKRQKNCSA